MAITTVDVDQEVLRRAEDAYGVRTNREAIDLALREVVMRKAQLDAIDGIAAMRFEPSPQHVPYDLD